MVREKLVVNHVILNDLRSYSMSFRFQGFLKWDDLIPSEEEFHTNGTVTINDVWSSLSKYASLKYRLIRASAGHSIQFQVCTSLHSIV